MKPRPFGDPVSVPFSLRDFIAESNHIEGIYRVLAEEIAAHGDFLSEPEVTVDVLARFVARIADAELRLHPGMNVRVGRHVAPPGGEGIIAALKTLLTGIADGDVSPFEAHQRYETLHPFMDGNGRSGRALWLHMMGGIERAPLGFLHTFYYQTLDAQRSA